MPSPLLLSGILLSGMLVAGQPVSGVLQSEVDRLIQLHGDGVSTSSLDQRKVILGHFFSKESNDAVAFFIVEGFHGGNYHGGYIAFFQGNDQDIGPSKKLRPFRLISSMQIGGRTWRSFDWGSVRITPGSLTISGKQWKAGVDANCCPSVPFTTTFRVRGGTIVEGE